MLRFPSPPITPSWWGGKCRAKNDSIASFAACSFSCFWSPHWPGEQEREVSQAFVKDRSVLRVHFNSIKSRCRSDPLLRIRTWRRGIGSALHCALLLMHTGHLTTHGLLPKQGGSAWYLNGGLLGDGDVSVHQGMALPITAALWLFVEIDILDLKACAGVGRHLMRVSDCHCTTYVCLI